MKELQLGFITDEEMADWCGKTLKNYKAKRSRWASTVLIKFAEFKLVKGGVDILKIHDPIFNPSLKKEVENKWRDCWGYNGDTLDTNTDCWYKLKPQLTYIPQHPKTGLNYISLSKCDGYGPAPRAKQREGRYGTCKYTFCAIVNGIPQRFSKQDKEAKAELEAEYLDKTYKQQKYEMRALYADYKRGDISKEEYEECLDKTVEQDLGWTVFEEAFNQYLKDTYGDTAYCDFRQELIERSKTNNKVKKSGFEF